MRRILLLSLIIIVRSSSELINENDTNTSFNLKDELKLERVRREVTFIYNDGITGKINLEFL